jgi:hypothetical protein
VAPDAWFIDALTWATRRNIVAGYPDGTFRADEPVTRGQVVSWMWVLAGRPEPDAPHDFTDRRASAWVADALAWAAEEGLVSGYPDGSFKPNQPVSRGQLAAILWQRAGGPAPRGPLTFTDVRPRAWYATAIAWLATGGYADGYPDNTFKPRDPVNRAQAVSWFYALRSP